MAPNTFVTRCWAQEKAREIFHITDQNMVTKTGPGGGVGREDCPEGAHTIVTVMGSRSVVPQEAGELETVRRLVGQHHTSTSAPT